MFQGLGKTMKIVRGLRRYLSWQRILRIFFREGRKRRSMKVWKYKDWVDKQIFIFKNVATALIQFSR